MNWEILISLIMSYLIGSIPFGWIIVWIKKHQDIRYHASGKMGTSNVIRMTDVPTGIITFFLDLFKGYAGVWVVRLIMDPAPAWMEAVGGFLAVLGHVYSIFIVEKRRDGRYYFRGGAGGMTSMGAAIALWPPVILYSGIPSLLIYFIFGYASVATMSINVVALICFIVRAALGLDPTWWYAVYAFFTLLLVLKALRPNIRRLRRGEERVMGFSIRGKIKAKKEAERTKSSSDKFAVSPDKKKTDQVKTRS